MLMAIFESATQMYCAPRNLKTCTLENAVRVTDGEVEFTFNFGNVMLESVTIAYNSNSKTLPVDSILIRAATVNYKAVKALLDALTSLSTSPLALFSATCIGLNQDDEYCCCTNDSHFLIYIPHELKHFIKALHDAPPNLSVLKAMQTQSGATLNQTHIAFTDHEARPKEELLEAITEQDEDDES
jgi:hypothetical protein